MAVRVETILYYYYYFNYRHNIDVSRSSMRTRVSHNPLSRGGNARRPLRTGPISRGCSVCSMCRHRQVLLRRSSLVRRRIYFYTSKTIFDVGKSSRHSTKIHTRRIARCSVWRTVKTHRSPRRPLLPPRR